MKIRNFLMTAAWLALAGGCASPTQRAEKHSRKGEWTQAVAELRTALAESPEDVELRSRLARLELEAAEHYYQRGSELKKKGFLDAALAEYGHGLAVMPENDKLAAVIKEGEAEREADALSREAVLLREAGKLDEARQLLDKALTLSPDHAPARQAMLALEEEEGLGAGTLALKSREPITLNFKGTEGRAAFDFLGKSFGVNMIFDDAVKGGSINLAAKDVTFEQGLQLLLSATQTFHKQVGPNTIMVSPDTPAKHAQYEDQIIRTFQLSSVKAADMSNILKSVLPLKRLTVNERLNALIVRDTPDMLKLTEQVISAHDRKPAEIVFDVEILEVNRTKAEQLGLNYGPRVSATFPSQTIKALTSMAFGDIVGAGTVALPSLAFNFFKQDVDAKVLASPKIRVLDGGAAKIHIGDRVPLRSSTIQDTTGQVRFTFEYRDIGIKLNAEPRVNLDNSVVVKLGLEVSSLGSNLGTDAEPAYSIGTRNADSSMLLRDGETAILGGLIRDEERSNRVKLPGLGSIPLIGPLFTTAVDNSKSRTDVLLTITPHVVRGWDVPNKSQREIYSGTEERFMTRGALASLGKAAGKKLPEIKVGKNEAAASAPSGASPRSQAEALPSGPGPLRPMLAFSQPQYQAVPGYEFEIRLLGENLAGLSELPLGVAFNSELLSFVKAEALVTDGMALESNAEAGSGVLRLAIRFEKGKAPAAKTELARIVLKAKGAGVSYLVYQAPKLKLEKGEFTEGQASASRILVR